MFKNALAILAGTLNLGIASADVNIRNFCKVAADTNTIEGLAALVNTQQDADNTKSDLQKILREADSVTIHSFFFNNHSFLFNDEAVIDWYLLKHSDPRVRLAAWNQRILPPSQPKLIETYTRKRLEGWSKNLGRPNGFRQSTETLLENAEFICKGFGVGLVDLRECADALKKTVLENDTILTQSGLVLSNINAWKRVAADRDHYYASYLLAQEIYRKVEFAKKQGFVYGNFYRDIIDNYQRIVKNKKIAEEKAWDLITLYATRGPVYNIRHFTQWSTGAGFNEYFRAIFVGMHILDSISIHHGYLYSLPESVNKTNCIISKPYHFWYSALVTRNLLKQGYSEKTARTVPYILGSLYNFGTTAFTDRDSFYSRNAFDPANNVVRLSMASRRLGIDYILQPKTIKNSTHQIDTILKKMIKTTDLNFKQNLAPEFLRTILPEALKERLDSYYKFEALFSIDELNPYENTIKYNSL